MDDAVREGVLIPRPETRRCLLSEVLSRLPRDKHVSGDGEVDDPDIPVGGHMHRERMRLLLACYVNPRISAVATDVDTRCVQLARDNAEALGLASALSRASCTQRVSTCVATALMRGFS